MTPRRPIISSLAVAALASLSCDRASADWVATYLQGPTEYQSQSFAASGNMQGGWAQIGGINRPVIWNSSSASMQVLLPQSGGWLGGEVNGMNGDRQVGWIGNQDGRIHAALWSGTGDSFVDLDPLLFRYRGTRAYAIRGSQVVGHATDIIVGGQHAAVWDVDQGTFRDIHPVSGSTWSELLATDGEYQGGWANRGVRAQGHAALWHGSSETYVDLTPASAPSESRVEGMAPGVQVGYATTLPGVMLAALWHGTAESFQSLNPIGAYSSQIHATTGTIHVGSVLMNGGQRWDPCVWMNDAPSSFVNLRQFLAPGWGDAGALAVSIEGDRLYVSGSGAGLNGTVEALLWVGSVPTPGTLVIAAAGVLVSVRRRRNRDE